ncbi:MAG: ABC transporter ATP-binding protein [Candidatus Gastranaerophilales bacterium]|nr:ABC transporter ATP-binding protein [Candidatus Gastranaerophilales bacterium]
MSENILEINNLKVEYKTAEINGSKIVKAVNGVSLELKEGETFAIAGESGCGKSTLAKAIMHLVPYCGGDIVFMGQDISRYSEKELGEYRKNVQMVFQNPYSSLNPKMTIRRILTEPLDINTNFSKVEKERRVEEITGKVGLDRAHLDLYPHEFSGGQRQRIAIARALMLKPRLIIADEPVSALDASIQAQILNMLNELKKEFGLTLLFISHDLSVIRFLADEAAIMYLGEIVETGTKDEIFNLPAHPYTKALLDAVPKFDKKTENYLTGDIPSGLPDGCKFSSRCKYTTEKCDFACPEFVEISPTHKVRCIL